MKINEFFVESELHDVELDEGVNDPNIFKAIFMAGPPGAGKNTVIDKLGLVSKGFKLQDVDRTLAYLKKSRQADHKFEKGLDVTVRRQSLLSQNMLGLIINTTGRDYESLMSINKQLMAAGYDTFMLFVDTEYAVAFDRIHNRSKNATDPADKDREVTLDYFNQAFDAVQKNLTFYSVMFDTDFAVVTNNARTIKVDEIEPEEHIAHRATFEKTLKTARARLAKFLNRPLTDKAQGIVSSVRSSTRSNN